MARFLPIPDPAGSLEPPRRPPPTALATATPEPEPNPREVAALDEATYALALRRCAELLHRLQALSLGNPFDRAGRGLKVLASRGARIARRITGMR